MNVVGIRLVVSKLKLNWLAKEPVEDIFCERVATSGVARQIYMIPSTKE